MLCVPSRLVSIREDWCSFNWFNTGADTDGGIYEGLLAVAEMGGLVFFRFGDDGERNTDCH